MVKRDRCGAPRTADVRAGFGFGFTNQSLPGIGPSIAIRIDGHKPAGAPIARFTTPALDVSRTYEHDGVAFERFTTRPLQTQNKGVGGDVNAIIGDQCSPGRKGNARRNTQ